MLSTKTYTVYKHTNKINGKVYIGITRQTPEGCTHYYNSIKEAGEQMGMRANTIARYVSGVRHDPKGRGWSYCL